MLSLGGAYSLIGQDFSMSESPKMDRRGFLKKGLNLAAGAAAVGAMASLPEDATAEGLEKYSDVTKKAKALNDSLLKTVLDIQNDSTLRPDDLLPKTIELLQSSGEALDNMIKTGQYRFLPIDESLGRIDFAIRLVKLKGYGSRAEEFTKLEAGLKGLREVLRNVK
jgi:hypothetical protein